MEIQKYEADLWLRTFTFNEDIRPAVVIDVQGFQLQHTFTVKELAIYDGYRLAHFVFKPKIPFKNLSSKERRVVRWSEDNHHCLPYHQGHVSQDELPRILTEFTRNFQRVYVKGHQKLNILRIYLNIPIVNLESGFEGVPNLRNAVSENCCMSHAKCPSVCSVVNVKLLYNFLIRENKLL